MSEDDHDNVAFGKGAMCFGSRCVAIGIGAEAHGDGAMAVGHGVVVHNGERKIAIGPCVGDQTVYDVWYEFFQSVRDSLAGSSKPEEPQDG